MSLTGTSSKNPCVKAYKITTCFSTESGLCNGCFNTSTVRRPRFNLACVAASKSEPNCVKASSSRYDARSKRSVPATRFIALIWAAPPTRDTDEPASMAGRIPELNRFSCKKICPSVIEITFVAM